MIQRIRHTLRIPTLPLLALVLLPVLLAACGGDEGQGDLPKATVRDGANPAAPAAAPAGTVPPPAAADATPPETVVVTVNGEPIRQADIETRATEMARRAFGGRPVPPQHMGAVRAQFAAQAEKQLVDGKLLDQALAKEGAAVSAEEVAARWKEIEERIPKGMTREQVLVRSGLTAEQAEVEIKREIQLDKLFAKHAPTQPVSDEVLREQYQKSIKRYETPAQVRARHILLKVAPTASAEEKAATKAKMDAIRAELQKQDGKDFAILAAEESACPSSAKGGDLEWFGRGQMVPEFDERAFTLEPGVVSEPFLTQFGYHILEVTDKREARTRPFDEVKDELKRSLEQGARQRAQSAYVETLRAAAAIEHPATK